MNNYIMILRYEGKKDLDLIKKTKPAELKKVLGSKENINKLILGENLQVMKYLLEVCNLEKKIDLVYIDPPFSTKNIFKIGKERATTISSSISDSIAYSDTVSGSEYIEFLRERLILIKELMSNTASIYLHIDYKIGHYVKIIMDEIFGINNFKNDITRIKCNPKNFKRKAYGNIKDLILFYTKSNKFTWNEPRIALTEDNIKRLFKKFDDKGRRYTTIPLHAPGETKNGPTGMLWKGMKPPKGRHWRSEPNVLEQLDKDGLVEWSSNKVPRKKIYADDAIKDGKKVQDIWEYKDAQYPTYPTEKNIELLKMIISASSSPGDLVFDCFCGSGSTLLAAHQLGRNWIGIDQSEYAIDITTKRILALKETLFMKKPEYELLKQIYRI